MFEFFTLKQTGIVAPNIPVVLFGVAFWSEIVNWSELIRLGVVQQREFDQLFFTDR